MNNTDLDWDAADPREEELVAYLDGELSDEQSRRVEEQLASDEAYRQSLQRLERAWNCLDELPVTAVGDTFTRSTVEMIAVAASEEIAQQQAAQPRQRRLRSVLTVGVLLASLLVGFFAVAVVWPDPNDRLVRDYGLLKDLDAYLQIQDVAFLRSLDQEIEAASKLGITIEKKAEKITTLGTEKERQAAISQLSPDEKAQLANAQERFDALTPERKKTVRQVYREIHQATDPEALLTTLSVYYQWTTQLSPGQRAELAGLGPEKRLEAIKKIYALQQQQLAQQLSGEDMKVMFGWLQNYVRDNQREILAKVPEHFRSEIDMRLRHDEIGKRRAGLMMMAIRRGEFIRTLRVSQQDIEHLMKTLSPPARQILQRAGSLQEQQRVVRYWVSRTVRTRMAQSPGGPQKPASQAELEKYFAEKLTNDQREQLLGLSGEEMQHELQRLYQDSVNLKPRSQANPGAGRPAYDRPKGRPGGPYRRGGPGGRPSGKTRREPPFDKRTDRGPFPPSREKPQGQDSPGSSL